MGRTDMKQIDYHNPERFADVMALIQVLALAEEDKRSEKGLGDDLQRYPRSAESWTQLAEGHPEFFRVRALNARGKKDDYRVSLIARAAVPKGDEGHREPLSSDLLGKFLDIAISLHDRDKARTDQWKDLLPIAGAIVAGLFAIAVALLKR
jgi:hypothetical protein